MRKRLEEIRYAEMQSHIAAYSQNELFSEGSWLAKPVKTVMDILPLFEGRNGEFRGLDLGCGVGRNCIPTAKALNCQDCRIDCVDILAFAIERLNENAESHGVSARINGIVSGIDEFPITENFYDLIMAVSALEHVNSEESFIHILHRISKGIRKNGIVCLIINSNVSEKDKTSKMPLPAQFEVNFETEHLNRILHETFDGWDILKHNVIHQFYEIPRKNIVAELDTDVVTFVAVKR